LKALKAGQGLRHDRYGIGIVETSSEERTTIEFYENGRRIFVTALLQAELLAEAPPRAPKPRAPGKTAAKKGTRAKAETS
jgi:hypothetical protein